MTKGLDIDATLGPESRVVIPARVRRALGVGPGDRVRFVIDGGDVRLVAAQTLLTAVWENNQGGARGDSVKDVRSARLADRDRGPVKEKRDAAAVAAETRSEDEIEEGLLAQLGLAR